LGTLLISKIREEYADRMMLTFSVFRLGPVEYVLRALLLGDIKALILYAHALANAIPSGLDILSTMLLGATIDPAATWVISSELPPTWPSRCSTLGGNRIECAPEVVKFVYMCAAGTEHARARPERSRLRRHSR
jgi:hypothetical protein